MKTLISPMSYDDTLTEFDFRRVYDYHRAPKTKLSTRIKDGIKCNKKCCGNFLLSFFPILTWLPNYKIKQYLPGDLIGGITTAIVRIPQSLAYGQLAGLQPINGMYVAFFAPITYTFLGTSRHVSVGTFAVISLMLGSALEKYLGTHPFTALATNSSQTMPPMSTAVSITTSDSLSTVSTDANGLSEISYNLSIVVSLTLLIGILQIGMGICKLGFVTVFLSEPLISGFTTGAALFVLTAQVKYFFGIQLPRQAAPFALFKTYIELFKRIEETNVAEVVLSVISLVILYPVKLINEIYKEKLHSIPIPIELVVVVIGTAVSASVDLNGKYGIDIVGTIPSGLPAPMIPNPSLWGDLVTDAFSIAIVSFAISVSIGKLFAKKHGYKVKPNQELFALGVSQLTCGMFQGHACSAALARSTVKESSGTKTQFSDVVSSIVILLVLLLIGQYLYALPKACLSAIIAINIRSLMKQFLLLPRLWSLSKPDFVVWLVTFTAVTLLGVDLGLAVGVLGLLVTVVLSVYKPKITVRGGLGKTEIYRDIEKFGKAQEVPGIKIVRFPQSPFFGNVNALQALSNEAMFVKKTCESHQNSEEHLLSLLQHTDRDDDDSMTEPSDQDDGLLTVDVIKRKPHLRPDVTESASDDTKEESVPSSTSFRHDDEANTPVAVIADESAKDHESDTTNSLTTAPGCSRDGENDSAIVMDMQTRDVHFSGTNSAGKSLLKRGSPERVSFNPKHYFHTIIFDCSGWTFIDLMGMETVSQICKDFKANNLRVYLASLQPEIMDKLIKVGVIASREEDQDDNHVTVSPSVRLAVEAAKRKRFPTRSY